MLYNAWMHAAIPSRRMPPGPAKLPVLPKRPQDGYDPVSPQPPDSRPLSGPIGQPDDMTPVMERAGEEFLTRSGFALNEHGDVRMSYDTACIVEDTL